MTCSSSKGRTCSEKILLILNEVLASNTFSTNFNISGAGNKTNLLNTELYRIMKGTFCLVN